MSFSSFLKEIRKNYDLTQVGAGKEFDISTTSVKLIEKGTTKMPSKKLLETISNYLNIEQLDVITNILFEDNNDSNTNYCIQRYLAYMYINGWNVKDSPYIFDYGWKPNVNIVTFGGRIVKKREPKNIVIVSEYNKHKIRDFDVESKETAFTYLNDLLSVMMGIDDYFRRFSLVFDCCSKEEKYTFQYFKQKIDYRIKFKIDVVLFDSKEGKIIDQYTVTGK